MTELKQCYDCRRFTNDTKLVTEFEDKTNGDSWGVLLCFVCLTNRRALKNEDARVQFGDDREWGENE